MKSGTTMGNLSSLELGKKVVIELLNRSEVDPKDIDEVIFGTATQITHTSNLSRQVSLASGIPIKVDRKSVV